jgi:endonuclease/exonuclease/phosphatase family metal-dependent hydrolase
MDIKVMTYNIHHGKGMDKKVDLNRIAKVISASKADIVGLNEVDNQFSNRSNYVNQISDIANSLEFYYGFSPSLTMKSKKTGLIQQYGNGILSRFPITSNKSYSFNFVPGLIEGRSMLETTIQVNDQFVNLYVTHLSLNPILHKKQSDFILEKTKENKKPVIILGDWNMRSNTRKWKRITKDYIDVWDSVGEGSGYTHPSLRPRIRLDYIFVSSDVQIVDATIVDCIPEASDHLPVISTLSI